MALEHQEVCCLDTRMYGAGGTRKFGVRVPVSMVLIPESMMLGHQEVWCWAPRSMMLGTKKYDGGAPRSMAWGHQAVWCGGTRMYGGNTRSLVLGLKRDVTYTNTCVAVVMCTAQSSREHHHIMVSNGTSTVCCRDVLQGHNGESWFNQVPC